MSAPGAQVWGGMRHMVPRQQRGKGVPPPPAPGVISDVLGSAWAGGVCSRILPGRVMTRLEPACLHEGLAASLSSLHPHPGAQSGGPCFPRGFQSTHARSTIQMVGSTAAKHIPSLHRGPYSLSRGGFFPGTGSLEFWGPHPGPLAPGQREFHCPSGPPLTLCCVSTAPWVPVVDRHLENLSQAARPTLTRATGTAVDPAGCRGDGGRTAPQHSPPRLLPSG